MTAPGAARPPAIPVRVQGLWKSYGGEPVLRAVDVEIEAGATLVILGGSGEGKSVLIRQIAGLETPDAGEVRLGSLTVREYRALPYERKPFRLSMVFQSAALLNSLTVFENVSLGLREHRTAPPARIREVVREALERVEMEGSEDRMPAELSGGMRKRVAIARALAADSQVILYDEPTAELDPILTAQMGALVREIQRTLGPTQIVVTHDLPLAREIADRVAVLHRGEVVDFRSGADFWQSDHEHSRRLLRAAHLLP